MSLEATVGPTWGWGQLPPLVVGQAPADYNSDRAPSGNDLGWCVVDPRYAYQIGGWMNPSGVIGGATPNPIAIGMLSGSGCVTNDQAPSAIATNNIAAAANVSSGVAMTLVSSSGAGITVMTASLVIPQTGLTVPAVLCIDQLPVLIRYGQTGAIGVPDPRTTVARALSITGVTSGTGGNFLVAGFDLYGQPQTETIAGPVGATTANGKKGWKFITSVTPQFTDAHNYSVGTTDIYEFPMRVDRSGYASISWNNNPVTSLTFVAADTTSPATSSTGSVRGTWVAPTASDGTKTMQVFVSQSPQNLAAMTPSNFAPMFGVVPA